jgi:hypothetical protein
MGNRHPVDQLAEIRAEKRRLSERENALRVRLLMTGADLLGDEHMAAVTTFTRPEINQRLLEQCFGRAAVAACTQTVEYRVVTLRKRDRQRRAPTQIEAVEALT